MGRLVTLKYRPRFLFFAFFSALGIAMCKAQAPVTHLSEVEISASPIQKFGVGAFISSLDSTLIAVHKQASLAQILGSQSAAYIKQYGSGMLATISFRGTGAGHTSVLWNGMQVGYPFLGQADFSIIPMDFIEELTLIHGTSSARFGSGAIGGVISINSTLPKKGVHVGINQSAGSFGTYNSSLQIASRGKKGFIRIGSYYKRSANNFPYKSATGVPFGKVTNADFYSFGAKLTSSVFISKTTNLSADIQATRADKNLQPSIGSLAAANQKDANFWSSVQLTHQVKNGSLVANYGLLYDEINYEGSSTSSYRNNAGIELTYDLLPGLSTETGINTSLISVVTPNYLGNKATENRTNVYSSLTWYPVKPLGVTANLRQAFISGYDVPFTPSLGLNFQWMPTPKWQIHIRSQLAKGYRAPTLNDRYWVPGGNPDLTPETSVNAELGLDVKHKGKLPFWLHATVYQLWVDNWILWLPNGSVWSPENKRKVKGIGFEMETGLKKTIGTATSKAWINYAFTRSTNLVGINEYDRSVGKQLPYTPIHNGNITLQENWKKWLLTISTVVTGKRFITADNETKVPGYALVNVTTTYWFEWHKTKISPYLTINNITNTNYQSIINKAMPGINFLAGVTINFNK